MSATLWGEDVEHVRQACFPGVKDLHLDCYGIHRSTPPAADGNKALLSITAKGPVLYPTPSIIFLAPPFSKLFGFDAPWRMNQQRPRLLDLSALKSAISEPRDFTGKALPAFLPKNPVQCRSCIKSKAKCFSYGYRSVQVESETMATMVFRECYQCALAGRPCNLDKEFSATYDSTEHQYRWSLEDWTSHWIQLADVRCRCGHDWKVSPTPASEVEPVREITPMSEASTEGARGDDVRSTPSRVVEAPRPLSASTIEDVTPDEPTDFHLATSPVHETNMPNESISGDKTPASEFPSESQTHLDETSSSLGDESHDPAPASTTSAEYEEDSELVRAKFQHMVERLCDPGISGRMKELCVKQFLPFGTRFAQISNFDSVYERARLLEQPKISRRDVYDIEMQVSKRTGSARTSGFRQPLELIPQYWQPLDAECLECGQRKVADIFQVSHDVINGEDISPETLIGFLMVLSRECDNILCKPTVKQYRYRSERFNPMLQILMVHPILDISSVELLRNPIESTSLKPTRKSIMRNRLQTQLKVSHTHPAWRYFGPRLLSIAHVSDIGCWVQIGPQSIPIIIRGTGTQVRTFVFGRGQMAMELSKILHVVVKEMLESEDPWVPHLLASVKPKLLRGVVGTEAGSFDDNTQLGGAYTAFVLETYIKSRVQWRSTESSSTITSWDMGDLRLTQTLTQSDISKIRRGVWAACQNGLAARDELVYSIVDALKHRPGQESRTLLRSFNRKAGTFFIDPGKD